jgi:hypothetical protein
VQVTQRRFPRPWQGGAEHRRAEGRPAPSGVQCAPMSKRRRTLRGHRVEASRLAVPRRPRRLLDKGQEPRGCVIHVPHEPKGACHAHWEGPVGRVPRSGCAELGEARARAPTSWALADVRSVSRNGLGNAVVRRPWQVEYACSLRLHIVPAKLNMPTAACYCPGGDRRGQFSTTLGGAMGKGRTADHPQKAGYPPHVNSSRALRPFRLF